MDNQKLDLKYIKDLEESYGAVHDLIYVSNVSSESVCSSADLRLAALSRLVRLMQQLNWQAESVLRDIPAITKEDRQGMRDILCRMGFLAIDAQHRIEEVRKVNLTEQPF